MRSPKSPGLPRRKKKSVNTFLNLPKKHNLTAKTDKVGNVVISKPATPGHENAPTVIMQGHMDMVCESNDKHFDFANSPIPAVIDGEWIRTNGTTLGADNGIGMAASLAALIDDSLNTDRSRLSSQ